MPQLPANALANDAADGSEAADAGVTPSFPIEGSVPEQVEKDPEWAAFNDIRRKHGEDKPSPEPEAQLAEAESDTAEAQEPQDDAPPVEPEPEADDTAAEQPTADKDQGEPDLDFSSSRKVGKLIDELGIKEDPDSLLDTALSAYKRDGALDADAMDLLYKQDPKKFVEGGLKRAKAQKDQDSFGPEYRKWLESQQGDGDGQDGHSDAMEGTPEPADYNSQIDEALQSIEDDEIVDHTAPAMRQMAEALRAEARAEADKRIREIQQDKVESDLQVQRLSMLSKGQYDGLKDDDTYDKVLERYDTILADKIRRAESTTLQECFAEACKWELGETNTQKLKERMLGAAKQRRQGSPKASTTGSDAAAKADPEAQADADEFEAFKAAWQSHGIPLT